MSTIARTSSDKRLQGAGGDQAEGRHDMYAAMEMTFKMRASGLDTIYFLSMDYRTWARS